MISPMKASIGDPKVQFGNWILGPQLQLVILGLAAMMTFGCLVVYCQYKYLNINIPASCKGVYSWRGISMSDNEIWCL